ncbi:M64 family metallopeptidase [Porticoccus sp. W117]|uniref:M64 family metallopeptidase n=1 Tax=Porticoccus sp. W117 TaxID=3054777 RepID=UPI002593503B|nr:M64 family metallopeptidase [Porticoccus sp. W117]MDM3869804.1 M64 family metallopeptidase [Porticoccus sp. W117]
MIKRCFCMAFLASLLVGCGGGGSDPAPITPPVAPNQAPVVSMQSSGLSVTAGDEFTLTASASDSDGRVTEYLWSRKSGPAINMVSVNQPTIKLTAPQVSREQSLVIQLVVKDDDGASSQAAEATVTVRPRATQLPPQVGFVQNNINLITGNSAQLHLSASDPDGQIASYQWKQLSGADLGVDEATTENLTITAPNVPVHQQATLEVTVTDNDRLTASATVTIHLMPRFATSNLRGRSDGKGVDLVLLAEGFTASELGDFRRAATEFMNHFLQEDTIKVHGKIWNVHLIESVSEEPGSDFPNDGVSVSTVFDSHFQCNNIARLICLNTARVVDVTARLVPQYDQIAVIVNSPTYGGSGGPAATFSLADSAGDIAIHELGHSFAGLADEYSYGSTDTNVVEPSQVNVTTNTDVNTLKWRHWIDDLSAVPTQPGQTGVGLFEGAYYREKDYYRPLDTSVMRDLGSPFGPVNAEAWALSVNAVAAGFISVTPGQENVVQATGSTARFSIETLFDGNLSTISWYINDQLQPDGGQQMLSLDVANPPATSYTVRVVVKDATGLIRKDSQNVSEHSHTWSVTVQ